MKRNKGGFSSDAGITMIETLLASAILAIGSLGMMGVVLSTIAANNRSKIDSTQTMLATSILEQINTTFIGAGSSTLTDCAGNNWTVDTDVGVSGSGGAALSGSAIDFTQAQSAIAGYYMNYVVSNPCTSTGTVQGTYDVRWNIQSVGTASSTDTYLLTVSAKLKNAGTQGNMYFASPITLRMMSGN